MTSGDEFSQLSEEDAEPVGLTCVWAGLGLLAVPGYSHCCLLLRTYMYRMSPGHCCTASPLCCVVVLRMCVVLLCCMRCVVCGVWCVLCRCVMLCVLCVCAVCAVCVCVCEVGHKEPGMAFVRLYITAFA